MQDVSRPVSKRGGGVKFPAYILIRIINYFMAKDKKKRRKGKYKRRKRQRRCELMELWNAGKETKEISTQGGSKAGQ